jgi:hypothetical protein
MYAIIIAQDGQLRSGTLIHEMTQIGFNVKIIQGFNANLYKFEKIQDLKLFKKNLFSELKLGEIACSRAHLDAYGFLASKNRLQLSEWNLIIEDDVEILDTSFFEQFRDLPKVSNPIILSLYSESFICLDKKNHLFKHFEFKKSVVPSTSTVAYMVNNSFLELYKMKERIVESRADWPYWITQKTTFYVVNSFKFKPSQFTSIIGNSNYSERSQVMFKFKAKNIIGAIKNKIIRIKKSPYKLNTFKNEFLVIIFYIRQKCMNAELYQRGYW